MPTNIESRQYLLKILAWGLANRIDGVGERAGVTSLALALSKELAGNVREVLYC